MIRPTRTRPQVAALRIKVGAAVQVAKRVRRALVELHPPPLVRPQLAAPTETATAPKQVEQTRAAVRAAAGAPEVVLEPRRVAAPRAAAEVQVRAVRVAAAARLAAVA